MDSLTKIFKVIENSRLEMIKMQTGLSRIPALAPQSDGDGEKEKAEYLKGWLNEYGITSIEEIQVPDKRVSCGYRPNLIATINGRQNDKRLWIMTHIDVVPPGELKLWESDPYLVVEKDGKLFGRGVEDNQQGLTASFFAAAGILKAGMTPYYTVKLLFVADEETHSEYGIRYIADHYTLFNKDDLIIVPDSGNPGGTQIEIAEKSVLWLKIITTGKQCHASRPNLGKNAFLAGSAFVLELQKLKEIFNMVNPIFQPSSSTFEPTKKEANVPNINTIPGEDVFYLDCRILPDYQADDVLNRIIQLKQSIEEKYNVRIDIETIVKDSSPATLASAPIVGILKQAVKIVYDKNAEVIGIGGGTVAAVLRKKGLDAVVWSTICDTAHMPNEYCIIDNMVGDCKVMASVMMNNC